MMPHALKVALLGCALALGGVGCAAAQDAPAAAPRCGGLLCDMGVFGGPDDRTTLPCDDFFCRAFGGGRSAQAAPPPAAVAEPEPAPAKPARKKRMAKARTSSKMSKAETMSKPDAGDAKPETK